MSDEESCDVLFFIHERVRLKLLAVILLSFFGYTFASVRVVWNKNSEPDLANYRVYWGTKSLQYSSYKEIWNQTFIELDYLETGKQYYLAVTAIDYWGNESTFSNEVVIDLTDKDNPVVVLPVQLELLDNYPNPFNPGTTISYSLPEEQDVEILIYNSIGQPVRELLRARRAAGSHNVRWDGCDNNGNMLPSGTYYYRLVVREQTITKKMTLLH